VGFHVHRPAEEEAAFLRDALDQDLSRTLAALDGERIVGTLYSFPAPLTLPGGAHIPPMRSALSACCLPIGGANCSPSSCTPISRAALQQTARTDDLWLRPRDVPALLAARRYAAPGQLVLDVEVQHPVLTI
jgi:hypothetical protein